MTNNTAIQKVTNYMRSDIVKARFAEIVGDRNAAPYISSVLLAVANDQSGNLAKCDPKSIYISALRAATLRLSVDPSTGQAYLVPFGGQATLIVGYKGLQDMAVRTGKYRYINIGPIYEGEEVQVNRISGFHSIAGNKTGDKIVGWLGAFELFSGFGKTFYMTLAEIHEHAKKYSKGYNFKDSVWKTDPQAMERKTVLRLMLRRWGWLDPNDVTTLEELEKENVIDGEFASDYLPSDSELEQAEKEIVEEVKRTEKENIEQLGFE